MTHQQQNKIRHFEYLLYLVHRYQVNNSTRFDSNILGMANLIFFITLADQSEYLGRKVFDFSAVPYGHQDIELNQILKQFKHKTKYYQLYTHSDTIIHTRIDKKEIKKSINYRAIDQSVDFLTKTKILQKNNFEIIKIHHNFNSWKKNYKKSFSEKPNHPDIINPNLIFKQYRHGYNYE